MSNSGLNVLDRACATVCRLLCVTSTYNSTRSMDSISQGHHPSGVPFFCYFWRRLQALAFALVPNSTTRTPATDMLYNTTNGRAHNNSTTCYRIVVSSSVDGVRVVEFGTYSFDNMLLCGWHLTMYEMCGLSSSYRRIGTGP